MLLGCEGVMGPVAGGWRRTGALSRHCRARRATASSSVVLAMKASFRGVSGAIERAELGNGPGEGRAGSAKVRQLRRAVVGRLRRQRLDTARTAVAAENCQAIGLRQLVVRRIVGGPAVGIGAAAAGPA